MKEKITIIVHLPDDGKEDLEVPIFITANDLILALDQIYSLNINKADMHHYYLKADNPKALLRGNRTLKEYDLRDGTMVWLWNR